MQWFHKSLLTAGGLLQFPKKLQHRGVFINFLYPLILPFKFLMNPAASLQRLIRSKMSATILLIKTSPFTGQSNAAGYIAGAVISLFIFGYLFYALVKPEKF